jgi:hypothetical protein
MLSTSMAPRETKRAGPLHERCVSYIDRMKDLCGIDQKEIALSIGMSETVFSQKRRGIRSHFYEDEFDAIAEFFRHKTGRPLTGFPHLEWDEMLTIDKRIPHWKRK